MIIKLNCSGVILWFFAVDQESFFCILKASLTLRTKASQITLLLSLVVFILQMSQELGITEKSPDFINPYRTERDDVSTRITIN